MLIGWNTDKNVNQCLDQALVARFGWAKAVVPLRRLRDNPRPCRKLDAADTLEKVLAQNCCATRVPECVSLVKPELLAQGNQLVVQVCQASISDSDRYHNEELGASGLIWVSWIS